ncbi:MAG TPA: PAS-domain containing protein, partial [Sphingomonadaceae bacterium]|nr:PAS-domain containing protein [Sphingomonadaceae bacterium]
MNEQPTRDGGVVINMTDVTSIRADRQHLAEQTGLLQATLEGMGEGILVLDAARRVLLVNNQFFKLVELPGDAAALGTTFADVADRLELCGIRDFAAPGGAPGAPLDDLFAARAAFQLDHQRPSGARLLIRANPLATGGWVLSLTDVTAERRALAALEESEARYRKLVDMVPDLICIYRDGRFLFVNPAGAHQLGVDAPEDLIGRRILDFVHPDCHEAMRNSRPGSLANGASGQMFEFRALRDDGSEYAAEGISLEFSHRGEPAIIGIVRDITLHKLAQAQLVQTSKLATLGEMAAGITHELNQPLNRIRIAADSSLILMEEGKIDHGFEREQFERISANAVRMAEIVSHMAAFSRREDDTVARDLIDP